jgi:hypothetical protein
MDDCSIAGRTKNLLREIELIQQAELGYRSHKGHSLEQNAEHEKREFRVLAIREELRRLSKEQSSNQATGQSGTVEFFFSGQ